MSISSALADELASAMLGYARRAPATTPPATAVPVLQGAVRSSSSSAAPLFDVGANMLDPMFQGEYREKPRHPADLPAVLSRGLAAGVRKIIITAGSLQESRDALALCRRHRAAAVEGDLWPTLCCTVGVHPTRCGEFEASSGGGPDAHLQALLEAGQAAGRELVVATGECGLDYERLEFCPRDVQLEYFELQVTGLAVPLGLPLFLHCRSGEAAQDMLGLLAKYRPSLPTPPGVVHSFDGSIEDARRFLELGFYIGLNGCSLRTPENLEVVKQLPSDRILLETDAPWCSIKASHAGHSFVKTHFEEVKKPEKFEEGKCVKDRCEPCHLRQVLEVVAGCRGADPEVLASEIAKSTDLVFFANRSGE
ncbi:unnamed protein product [Polarella glacialis]|uniref:Uncharacterized protein n=1 Tax=Polarella glacialis TaxID=89957 RepID=A0A813JB06_POLGL|nr:unnamed protein product [Polarella glacialis]